MEFDAPRATSNDPHKLSTVRRRHEIDNRRPAGLSLEFGFEDKRAGAIVSTYREGRLLRSSEPSTMIGCPQQGGKA